MLWMKPLILASTVLLAALAILLPLPLLPYSAQARTIDVTARTFAYDPGIIQVHRGDKVTLRLESQDTVHGLSLDGYDVDLQAEPGKSSEVTFVAEREGTYRFRCSVTCGVLHPFMIGELQVTPDLPFGRALAALSIAVAGALAYFRK